MAERIHLGTLMRGSKTSSFFAALAKRIEAGAVFVYPTETIYGIGGRADKTAIKNRIIRIKSRQPENPMILVAGRKKVIDKLGIEFPEAAMFLAKHFWPGRLTLVLPYKNRKDFIGVRVSDYPFITRLYDKLSVPIFSTSANISGKKYMNDPNEIFSVFKSKIDFMIDAGPLPPSPPSTVVKILNDKKIEMIREGAVSTKEIIAAFVHEARQLLRNT